MSGLQMTQAEREAFLAEPHIGVIALNEPDRGPLAAPIWHLTAPLLRPIQRVVPRLGGFDISPLILFVIAQILLMVIANVSRGVA